MKKKITSAHLSSTGFRSGSRTRFFLIAAFFAFLVTHVQAAELYRFSYQFNGAARGRILFFIPYRAFYQSQASAVFNTGNQEDKSRIFRFLTPHGTACMFRSTGFQGRTLVILTAHEDMRQGIAKGRDMWRLFKDKTPYYPEYVRKIKEFQFKFHKTGDKYFSFVRSPQGDHRDIFFDMQMRFRYFPEKLNINFNLYRIMAELLKTYNHPLMQVHFTGNDLIPVSVRVAARSPALDFTDSMNRIGPLAARFIGSLKRFRQSSPIRVYYCLSETGRNTFSIAGVSNKEVKIWGRYFLRSFERKAVYRKNDLTLLRDSIQIKIDKNSMSGMVLDLLLEKMPRDSGFEQ